MTNPEVVPPPQPEDVFTPRAPVESLMFIGRRRDRLGERIVDGLNEVGAQLVLHGDTGAGKTSLVLHVGGSAVARVECHRSKTFQDLLRDAFGAMGSVQELRVTQHDRTEVGASGGGELGLGFVAKFKGTVSASDSKETVRELDIVEQPLIDALIATMQAAGKRILLLDNFDHVVDANVGHAVAELMVAMSDKARSSGNLKIVVAGIAESAGELLNLSEAASRRTVSVGVSPMLDEEIRELVVRGMGLLQLVIGPTQVERIVSISSGYPYVAHLICLHAARVANSIPRTVVDRDAVDRALSHALDDFQLDFDVRYQRAVESSGVSR
ncbi:MAG: AAA family ATPase, partial [Tepidiformaceae bacterium]